VELAWIDADAPPEALPPPHHALKSPNGLLAAGGRLSSDWILHAYRHGAFPWYERGQPILWWSPDPRAVLPVGALKISRSLRRKLAREPFDLTADTAFAQVITACSQPRSYERGTWITPAIRDAYLRLHIEGWAHSFEAWQDEELVGGLYGIAIGRVFFGESMFTRATDASKVAFAEATSFFAHVGIELIDCQVWTAHLASLGAIEVARKDFLATLERLTADRAVPGPWARDFADYRTSSARVK
jgi:leucyl/phenylalanyl-tRNA--protein transferase